MIDLFPLVKPVLVFAAWVVGLLTLVCVLALWFGVKIDPKQWAIGGAIKARRPLTPNEQKMFFRLSETFPDQVVLAQVAFSALIAAPGRQRAVRNTFDRKIADFVLCDKAFNVIAVIELDDSSHRNRAREDAARTALLEDAGYEVIRYMGIPDRAELRRDFQMDV